MKKSLILLCMVAGLAFLPLTWYASYNCRLITLIFYGLFGVAWLNSLIRSKESSFFIPRLILPVGLLTLLQLGYLFFASPGFVHTPWILYSLLGLLAAWLVVDTQRMGIPADRWEAALMISVFALTFMDAIGLFQWYREWGQIAGSWLAPGPVAIRSTSFALGHPNLASAYLNLAIPLAIGRILKPGKWVGKVFWGVFTFYLLASQFFGASRSGWLGLALGLLVMMAMIYWKFRFEIAHQFRAILSRWSVKKRLVLLTVLILCGVLIVVFSIPLAYRQMFATAHGTFEQRADIWQFAWGNFLQSPWVGEGPGSGALQFALRREGFGVDEVFHTHSLWLQTLAGMGLAGFGLVLWALGVTGMAADRGWKKLATGTSQFPPKTGISTWSLSAWVGSLTAVFTHAFLDYHFFRLTYLLGVMVLIGLVYRAAAPDLNYKIQKRTVVVILMACLAIYAGVAFFRLEGMKPYQSGIALANRGDWQSASQAFCRVTCQAPSKTGLAFACSLALSHHAVEQDRPDLIQEALDWQRTGLAAEPNWYIHWANLAALEWQAGDRQHALEHMRKTAEMAPKRAFLWLNLGWMSEQNGDGEAARGFYQQALTLNTRYARSLFFERTGLRRAVRDDLYPSGKRSKGWDAVYKALEVKQSLSSEELKEAEKVLLETISRWPGSNDTYAYLALINQFRGDETQATRYMKTAKLLSLNTPFGLQAAAHLAHLQNNPAERKAILSSMFNLMSRSGLSEYYYKQAYDMALPPTDLSPFLVFAILDQTLQADLGWLAQQELQNGNIQRAKEIENWLAREIEK